VDARDLDDLAAIAAALPHRVSVYRDIIDPDFHVVAVLYRGCFIPLNSQGDTHDVSPSSPR
jgi:hypothetical protein